MKFSTHQDWLNLERKEFIDRWYSQEYQRVTYSGIARVVQRMMHESLEARHTKADSFRRVLEVGGLTGQHRQFVQHSYESYVSVDLIHPNCILSSGTYQSSVTSFVQADVHMLPFAENTFDRVLCTCLLHHLDDPEFALMEMRRVVKPQGKVDLFLSADPGLLFRLARTVGPHLAARLEGLGSIKSLVDARDHRNHVGSLRRIIRHVFRNDTVVERSYPVPRMTWNSSLWFTYRISFDSDKSS